MTLDQEQAQPGGAKPSNSLRGIGSLRIAAVRGGLSQDDLNQLDSLADTCLSNDRFTVKLNRNMLKERTADEINDFAAFDGPLLVGYLGLYSFQTSEVEISGLVHPDYRRSGLFTHLLQLAAGEAETRGIPKLVFIAPRSSSGAGPFVKKIAGYAYSEYVMELLHEGRPQAAAGADKVGIRPAGPADKELLIRLNQDGFQMTREDAAYYVESTLAKNNDNHTFIAEAGGEPIGKIGLILLGDTAMIIGFVIAPELRGRGYGRAVLFRTICHIRQSPGFKNIKLEVAAANDHALGLYRSCGFEVTDANDYYECGTSSYSYA
ncbi:GNAT family N-acetyltransferase [Paenibacillus sp. RC84]|uniref:GNAT family N-acetyltransferase n=1 Tax=Paenibacillus sp. RC84 TaxID=3156252 RepID=UPI0035197765